MIKMLIFQFFKCITILKNIKSNRLYIMTEFLDVELLSSERVTKFELWELANEKEITQGIKQRLKDTIIGMLNHNNTEYHAHIGFNKFSKETYPLPSQKDGWIYLNDIFLQEYYAEDDGSVEEYLENRIKQFDIWVKKHYCNPTAKMFVPQSLSISTLYPNAQMYKTLDNYSVGFYVFINLERVYVYGRTKDVIPNNFDTDDIIIFTELVASYDTTNIFIGQSRQNKMTEFSGGYGPKWEGNSILLELGYISNIYTYIFIGPVVTKFYTDERIIKYSSSVGNNCVPYPYAESLNWCYGMSDMRKSLVSEHGSREYLGNISYIDGVMYYDMDHEEIHGRNSWEYSNEIIKNRDDIVKVYDIGKDDATDKNEAKISSMCTLY